MIELDGEDFRRRPIEQHKQTLGKLVRGPHPGFVLNEQYVGDSAIVYQHGLQARLRGYRVEAARIALLIRAIQTLAQHQKILAAPTVKREAEEDLGALTPGRGRPVAAQAAPKSGQWEEAFRG
jgi:hypothetical protein